MENASDSRVPLPPDFSVGEWTVQPSLGRLSRGETTIRLRPQLMDVLVCLASGNGRTVMKQSVFDTVWSDRFVAESALARSVAELRVALGDSARHPTFIETIHKRGYRIIAPIAPRNDPPIASAGTAVPAHTNGDGCAPAECALAPAEIRTSARGLSPVLVAVILGVLVVAGLALLVFT